MRHLPQTLSVIILFAAFSALLQAQTIYVWEDSQGRKHYTQLKPSEHMQHGINKKQDMDSYIPDEADTKSFSAKQPTRAFLIESDAVIEKQQNDMRRQEVARQKAESEREQAEKEAAEKREKEAQKEELSTIAQEEKRRKENCETARTNLETVSQYLQGEYSELKYVDAEGTESTLDKDQIEKIHASSLEEVDYFCD